MALVLPPGELASRPSNDREKWCQELGRLCIRGYTEQVIQLISSEAAESISLGIDADGSSALHLAVLGGHLKLTQELLARKCNVDTKDSRGRTALQVASLEGSEDLVAELLLAEANPNEADGNGQTALHKAVLADGAKALQVLLDYSQPELAKPDSSGATPVFLACEYGKTDHLSLLLAKDAKLSSTANNNGWTPLHIAAHGLQKIKNSHRPSKFRDALQMLIQAKAGLEATDENGKTALHRAAAAGNCDNTRELLLAGANVHAADECRWTALHHACQDGHLGVIRLLLDAKAKGSTENPPCLTPLAVATMENQVKVAELLLQYNADPNSRGKGLASPIMLARKDPVKYRDVLALFEIGFIAHLS